MQSINNVFVCWRSHKQRHFLKIIFNLLKKGKTNPIMSLVTLHLSSVVRVLWIWFILDYRLTTDNIEIVNIFYK